MKNIANLKQGRSYCNWLFITNDVEMMQTLKFNRLEFPFAFYFLLILFFLFMYSLIHGKYIVLHFQKFTYHKVIRLMFL